MSILNHVKLKLGDLAVFFPAGIISSALKYVRMDMLQDDKKFIEEHHLYHFTGSKATADAIVGSGHLRPARGLFKNANSYGESSVCMFAGIPSIDNFVKNLSQSPLENPELIMDAVEIDIRQDELNNNYKIRKFADEAVLYEGHCILPEGRARSVQMVTDLIRDEEGNPVIDSNTHDYAGIEIREARPEEIERIVDLVREPRFEQREDPITGIRTMVDLGAVEYEKVSYVYHAQQDYLDYMERLRDELGYSTGTGILDRIYNKLSKNMDGGKLEGKEVIRSTRKNFVPVVTDVIRNTVPRISNGIKSFLERNNLKKIDEPLQDRMARLVQGRTFLERKNPYREKKFTESVSNFRNQGISQLDFAEGLADFNDSPEGMFLRDKHEQLQNENFSGAVAHEKDHSERVAILAMMIARNEGVFREDSDREREILAQAAYYHDIGRVLPVGPHAKRGARLTDEIEMVGIDGQRFSDRDKNIVRMLIEGHEGKDKNIDKLLSKYNISEEDREMAKMLLFCLKDADALDRARLTANIDVPIIPLDPLVITDLDPKYLRLSSSKALLEFSYGLEYVSANMQGQFGEIMNFGNTRRGEHYVSRNGQGRDDGFIPKAKVNEQEAQAETAKQAEQPERKEDDFILD